MFTRAKQGVIMGLTSAAVLGMCAGSASAHSGDVMAWQNCTEWHAAVTLHHNVTPDRTVQILSTIPGVPGVTGHYNTNVGMIWQHSGPGHTHGTVTLNVYRPNGSLEFTDQASLQEVEGCITTSTTTIPRSTSTTTSSSSTSTTVAKAPATPTTFVPKRSLRLAAVPTEPELPRTGSTSLPLAIGAFVLCAIGGAAASLRKKVRA